MNQAEPTDRQRLGEIIPPELAVKAMRDSGYKNTAYALAELIDNSVQANANEVSVICVEKREHINKRTRLRLKKIGVLDNGAGMSPETLRLALQFGNGTHLTDRKGIGRFGMGLPNSSISQCRRVEVWTWQNGPDNAMYTHLDVDEIEGRKMSAVPAPRAIPLPDEWRTRSQNIQETGTLVLWSNFDDHRLSWRGAKATLNNTEFFVGRMYRKFIDDGRLAIRLLALLEDTDERTLDKFVHVNDPLYLMRGSSTPTPFSTEPMFQRWEEKDEVFPINYKGETHEVVVRISWAREETVPADKSDRGAKPYGKHAAKNVGLSIVREDRELILDKAWTNSYDPTERWWGVEVNFPSTLDEVFGVTNSKQDATNFSQMAQFEWRDEADGESMSEFLARIQGDGDPRAFLLPIVDHIRQQIKRLRPRLKKQTAGRRQKTDRHGESNVSDRATTKFRERAEHGHKTDSDYEEFTKEDRDSLEQDLIKDNHYPRNIANEIAQATLVHKRKVQFLDKAMESYAFFTIDHKQGGLTAIEFNTNHPLHEQLIESLHPEIGDESDADLIDRIYKAADTLNLLFAAWARYEMEEVQQQDRFFEIRQEWGKMARVFLTEREDG